MIKTFDEFLNESYRFENYEPATAKDNMEATIESFIDQYSEQAIMADGFKAISDKLGTPLDKIVYLSTEWGERDFLVFFFPRLFNDFKNKKTIWKHHPSGDPTSHNRIKEFDYKELVFCEWSGANWDGESLYVIGEKLVEYMIVNKKADAVFRFPNLRSFFLKFMTPELREKYRGLIAGSMYGI